MTPKVHPDLRPLLPASADPWYPPETMQYFRLEGVREPPRPRAGRTAPRLRRWPRRRFPRPDRGRTAKL